MSNHSLLRFFVPLDRKFFPLFAHTADAIFDAVVKFQELILVTKKEERDQLATAIFELEKNAAGLKQDILDELGGSFITPFDREDVYDLIQQLFEIVRHLHSAVDRIRLYNLPELPVEFTAIVDCLQSSCKEIKEVLHQVHTVRDFRNFEQSCIIINDNEREADDIYQEYLSFLFDNETNAIELIKRRDILMALEKSINASDKVGKIFSSLMIKMN
ncbi:MAG: DUF47 family protein [Marinilabiliales bacterium]|nr:DUF47 family protein [Marinilabiliales bacterium]